MCPESSPVITNLEIWGGTLDPGAISSTTGEIQFVHVESLKLRIVVLR